MSASSSVRRRDRSFMFDLRRSGKTRAHLLATWYHQLPDKTVANVLAAIGPIKTLASEPGVGILQEAARLGFLKQMDFIRGHYAPMAFPSTGVTYLLAEMSEP